MGNKLKILAFGDSLTAGYTLRPSEAYPAQLEVALKKVGFDVEVVNAGVSGDTTGQGLRRVEWNLKKGPFDYVLLCLGANDGLRQLSNKQTKDNLKKIIKEFKKAKVEVILLGMQLPTNFSPKYRSEFEKIYVDLASEEKLSFLKFILEGVAAKQMLNQEDQIHPNVDGYKIIAANISEFLIPIIKKRPTKNPQR